METPEILALKAAISSANSWNEVAAWCSVLGGVIGLAALLIFRKRIPFAEKAMLVAAGVLVLLGGGGRLVFGARASIAASQLQQLSDQRVAGLKSDQERDHKIAMQAASHAADLGVTIDTLQDFVRKKEEVADLQFAKFKRFSESERKRNDAVIAELRTNGSKLEKARNDALAAAVDAKSAAAKVEATADKFIPRRLTELQVRSVAQQLSMWALIPAPKPLPNGGHLGNKQIGYFGSYPYSAESNALSMDFGKIFTLAGWDSCCEENRGAAMNPGGLPAKPGIFVEFLEDSPRSNRVADAFVIAMKSVGVTVIKVPGKSGCHGTPAVPEELLDQNPGCTWISVVVGEHP